MYAMQWAYRFEFNSGPSNFAVQSLPQSLITCLPVSLRGLVRQKFMVIGGLGPDPNLPNVRAATLSLLTNGHYLALSICRLWLQSAVVQCPYLILRPP